MTRPLTGSKRFTKLGKRETILWMQAKRMQKFCVEQLGMTPSKARRWIAETVKAMGESHPAAKHDGSENRALDDDHALRLQLLGGENR
jgi:hypothetical protein